MMGLDAGLEGERVPHYRCYFLGDHAHIDAAEYIEADSDAEAHERAEAPYGVRHTQIHGFDLWQGARFVGHGGGAARRATGPRPAPPPQDAGIRSRGERYRMKAEEIRTSAEAMHHGAPREAMLRLAASYDALADRFGRLSEPGEAPKANPKKSG
jgi:hypothetical protein